MVSKMKIKGIGHKLGRAIKNRAIFYIFQFPRIVKYRLLSNSKNVLGRPQCNQPVVLLGKGTIQFGKNVNLGVVASPGFYNMYGYIDARNIVSKIVIGDNVHINNCFFICSEGEGIEIRENTLIGTNCQIMDSDFHDLDPERRTTGIPKTAKVIIGKNVFIGNNVSILKGVTIGDNSVIGTGAVVTKSVPANTIAGGNPAVVIRDLH